MIKIISIDVVNDYNSNDNELLLERCKKLEKDKDSMLNDCTEFYNRLCEYKKEVRKLKETIYLLKIENKTLKDILEEKEKNINELKESNRKSYEIFHKECEKLRSNSDKYFKLAMHALQELDRLNEGKNND